MAALNKSDSSRAAIWDLPLRLFHWSLLAAVVIAAVTGFLLPANWLNLHIAGGTAIVVLLLFRFVWGFTGSAYSRFASFAFSPATVIAYARDQLRNRAAHYPGHNPLGAAMIFALLVVLAILAVTGFIVLGGTEKQGPLRAVVSYMTGSGTREIHQLAAYALLVLIFGHVAGVVVESRRSRENLAVAMVTGLKRVHGPVVSSPMGSGTALFASLILAAVIGGPAWALWRMPAPAVPDAALDPEYVKECGDCHIPFHPSLRSAVAWSEIMNGLDDHFGEDATLADDVRARLTSYLTANAAEKWDTRAANVFRQPTPLRVTATQFWERRHAGLDPSVFKMKAVGTKSNCEACHGDARRGLFTPQAIDIPEEHVP